MYNATTNKLIGAYSDWELTDQMDVDLSQISDTEVRPGDIFRVDMIVETAWNLQGEPSDATASIAMVTGMNFYLEEDAKPT